MFPEQKNITFFHLFQEDLRKDLRGFCGGFYYFILFGEKALDLWTCSRTAFYKLNEWDSFLRNVSKSWVILVTNNRRWIYLHKDYLYSSLTPFFSGVNIDVYIPEIRTKLLFFNSLDAKRVLCAHCTDCSFICQPSYMFAISPTIEKTIKFSFFRSAEAWSRCFLSVQVLALYHKMVIHRWN